MACGAKLVAYPFFTASICKSTHQSPGVPIINHRAAFLPNDPMGSHCTTRKYVASKEKNIGSRKQKRKICRGQYKPGASVGTGRNGAIPDAES